MSRGRGTWLAGAVLGLWTAGVAASALAADPVAVLTEFRSGSGEVRVRLAGESAWTAPQPLLALRPGDQVRVSGDGRAVVVFSGGRAPQTVTGATSPFTVTAPGGGSGGDRVHALVGSVSQYLFGKQDKPAYVSLYAPLTTRSARVPPPVLLSPRQTRLLPGPVTFEWSGAETLRYHVRLFSPEGLLWERSNLRRQPVPYPADAPPLKPGVRYAWELHAERHPVQRGEFEIVEPGEARRVTEELGLLTPATLKGQPPSTVTLIRAGLLAREGLYDAARRELQQGIAGDPNEPSLHQLLGHVYDHMGMKELAADAFDEARYLSGPKP